MSNEDFSTVFASVFSSTNGDQVETDSEKEERMRYLRSLGNFAHRYPVRKELWEKMSDITIQGATLYSFGIDPDSIAMEMELGEDSSIETPPDYWDRLRIIMSAVRSGSIDVCVSAANPAPNKVDEHTLIKMKSFQAWIGEQKFLPAEAIPTYPQFQPNASLGRQVVCQPENLSYKERKSMLLMIYAMAVDGYGYDPKNLKNTLTGDGTDSLLAWFQKQGLKITSDTIRKYLKEATALYQTN